MKITKQKIQNFTYIVHIYISIDQNDNQIFRIEINKTKIYILCTHSYYYDVYLDITRARKGNPMNYKTKKRDEFDQKVRNFCNENKQTDEKNIA